ncbi:MAG: hypothetical protein C0623_11460 [Desulfuromonas sp.]|nr:MAG: hypothetical protein C0623_11460 [Desulfuromonas sp.]
MIEKKVKNNEANSTLLTYLQQQIAHAPVSYLRQLIRTGKINLNGSRSTPEQLLVAGDCITLPQSQRLLDLIERSVQPLTILYESEEVLIVHKPAGLATHSSQGHEHDNLVSQVVSRTKMKGQKFKIAAIHRLDVPTSGPVIFGKGQQAIATLGRLMQENGIKKKYLALVKSGLPQGGLFSGGIASKGKIKYAETRFRILDTLSGFDLLELELRTGRQHQIRKHLADRGYPIAGDNRYSGPATGNMERLFLHCHYIELTNPFSGEQMTLYDPLPPALLETLQTLGLDDLSLLMTGPG